LFQFVFLPSQFLLVLLRLNFVLTIASTKHYACPMRSVDS
jgi:hypothetical protein